MTPQERQTLIQQAMQAFNPHYQESIQQVFADSGIQGPDWFFSYLAYGLEPEPLTAVTLHQMTPYTNIKTQAERLAQTAKHGYLKAAKDDDYYLTDAGREVVQAFFASASGTIAPLTPLSPKKMARLADLLFRIITATEAADPPSLKTHTLISRRTDPGPKSTASSKIDQYLTDLLRYRDDAHLAAWVDLDVDGRTWETFTSIWHEQANTVTALAETLGNRGYTEADYAASLEKLIKLGWIKEENGAYQVSENGRKLREEAEETTDRYYFIGWSSLTDAETAELDTLLTQLRDRLLEMAADKATTAANDIWPLAGEISGSLFKLTRPVMDPLFEEMGLAENRLAVSLIQAGYFDPEPVTIDRIRIRSPYSSLSIWEQPLQIAAERGLLTTVDDGEYTLTEDGRSVLNRLLDTFRNHLKTINLDTDLERLAELLGRIIAACLNAPEPPGTWAIRHSHNIAPEDDAPALAKIDQHLDDLNAFRDDAHTATFAPHNISGHGWELFTNLWRGDVHNPSEMVEKMGFRGHDESAYAAALDDLIERGWVKSAAAGATLTDKGKEIREATETQTDRYFYLPWLALNQAETAELRDLMTTLNGRLKQLVAAETVPA